MDAGISTAAAGTYAVQVHAKPIAQYLIQVQMQVHHAKVQVQVQQVQGSIR